MRNSRYIVILLLGVLLMGCTIRPSSVLSNKQMVDVLVDLHRAEGTLQVAGYNYGHDEDVKVYYAMVLDKHGITQAQFDSSVVWYTEHPSYFQSVYPKVLSRLEEEYDAADAAEKAAREVRRGVSLQENRFRNDTLSGELFRRYRFGIDYPLYKEPEPAKNCMDSLYQIQKMQKNADF